MALAGCDFPLRGDSPAGGTSTTPGKNQKQATKPAATAPLPGPSPTPAPLTIQYIGVSATYVLGEALKITPKIGGRMSEVAVEPELPSGLALDAASGEIAGSPLEVTTRQTYTVTATSSAQPPVVVTTTLAFAIGTDPKTAPGYRLEALHAVTGAAIDPVDPVIAGPSGSVYSVEPALPRGLELDPSTGHLAGTPTVAQAPAPFHVRVTSAEGELLSDETITASSSELSQLGAGRGVGCARLSSGVVSCWGLQPHSLAARHRTGLDGAVGLAVSGSRVCAIAGDSRGVVCMNLGASQALSILAGPSGTPLEHVRQIALGASHLCVLDDGGRVLCAGHNAEGQLGRVPPAASANALAVEALKGQVAALAAGGDHTCAVLKADGSVVCWGQSMDPAEKKATPVPTPVIGLSDVTSIAVGRAHACVVASGRVWCWGRGAQGQLGDGRGAKSLVPVAVDGQNVGDGAAVEVAVGEAFSCTRFASGAVSCWGLDSRGQLGGSAPDGCAVDAPTEKVTGPKTGKLQAPQPCALRAQPVPALKSGVTALSAGGDNACVMVAGPASRCWGGRFGQSGAPVAIGPWR